jgi:hypothetical protein
MMHMLALQLQLTILITKVNLLCEEMAPIVSYDPNALPSVDFMIDQYGIESNCVKITDIRFK